MPQPRALHLSLAAAFSALAALASGPAAAQSSPYYLGVAQALTHESNLYRVGDGQVLPAGLSKSDTVSGTSLVAGLDQRFGRQRLYGNANLRANRYASNKSLDNESYGLNLALDWATINRLSGTLSLASSQNLAQFNSRTASGTLETRKNVQRTDELDARFRLGGQALYTLEAGLGYRQRGFSATEYDRLEYRQNSGSLGLRYRPSALLDLGAALRLTRTEYPRFRSLAGGAFEADQLRREDIDLTANWTSSAISQLKLRVSPTRTRYDRSTGSDFSGLTGSAQWLWQPTGKLRFDTSLSRDTGQSSDAINLGIFGNGVTDYSRTTHALAVRANYELSAKVALNAGVSLAHRGLRDALVLPNVPAIERSGSDDTRTLTLGARWQPSRAIQLGCDARAENRSSSNSALSVGLSGNSFSCYGQLVMQ